MHSNCCNNVNEDKNRNIEEDIIRDEIGMCKDCNGSGESLEECSYCKGTGYFEDTNTMPKVCSNCGGTMLVYGECKRCDGEGFVDEDGGYEEHEYYCRTCYGKKIVYITCDKCVDGLNKNCPECRGQGSVRQNCPVCNKKERK